MTVEVNGCRKERVGSASRRLAGAAIAGLAFCNTASAQVDSVSLQFNGTGNTVAATGFDAAYNPNPAGFTLVDGSLVVLTLPGDTFGGYEVDPDSAQNFFYSNMNVGQRTVLEAKVNAININQNFHGGGIWMGTDQDHYIRLGIIHNSFEGGVAVEALRENEDRWRGGGGDPGDPSQAYPNRPGFDIESRYLNINDSATAGNVNNAILRIIRDKHAVSNYISLDSGATFTRIGGTTFSFNSLATDATTLPIDNRPTFDPNNTTTNPTTASPSVEGGYKIGAYALGGGSSQGAIQFDYVTAMSGTSQWVTSGGGEWTSDANWTAGMLAPTTIESTAVFGNSGAARAITVGSDITATDIVMANAAGDTISGAGVIRFDWFYFPSHPTYYTDGPGTVTVSAGNQTISAPTLTAHMHQFNVATGASLTLSNMQASPAENADAGVRKLGAGTMRVNRLLTSQVDVQAGTLQVIAGGGAANVSVVKSVAVATGAGSTAKLDLTDNAMVIDYTDSSPLVAAAALVASGYANGAQNGAGIITSTGGTSRAVGVVEASALVTVPAVFGTVDATSVLLRTTYKGDTDLNGAVNFDDLLKLAQSYGLSSQGWINGDSNYDGTVNFDDLLSLAQNYGLGALVGTTLTDSQLSVLGESFSADWAAAVSLVPEPTSLAVFSAASMLVGRRRRTI